MAGISAQEFKQASDEELAEIERRRQRYLGDRSRLEIADRMTIVVDDGVATGATTRAALRATRLRKPKKLVLAIPVGPKEVIAAMREEADEVICLEERKDFGALGFYYADFHQVDDQDVIGTLARFPEHDAKSVKRPNVKAWRCV
jgi:predicted phosphoribosyltransferase